MIKYFLIFFFTIDCALVFSICHIHKKRIEMTKENMKKKKTGENETYSIHFSLSFASPQKN